MSWGHPTQKNHREFQYLGLGIPRIVSSSVQSLQEYSSFGASQFECKLKAVQFTRSSQVLFLLMEGGVWQSWVAGHSLGTGCFQSHFDRPPEERPHHPKIPKIHDKRAPRLANVLAEAMDSLLLYLKNQRACGLMWFSNVLL